MQLTKKRILVTGACGTVGRELIGIPGICNPPFFRPDSPGWARHGDGQGELRIFNQFTETFSVNNLAAKVKAAGSKLGLEVTIQHLENPRLEAEDHDYNPRHTELLELGLKPHYLDNETLIRMMQFAVKHKKFVRQDQFYRKVKWA